MKEAPKIPKGGRKLENIIYEGNEIHGEDKINYKHLNIEESYPNNKKFNLECEICNFIWITNVSNFLCKKMGCPWCKNKCKDVKILPFFMIEQIGKRIHNNKFIYSGIGNDENKIYKKNEDINVKCDVKDHRIFTERLGKHLSVSKNTSERSKGCLICKKNEEKKPAKEKIIWKNNYDAVCKKSIEVYGEGTYSYYLTKPNSLKNINSELTIICNVVKDGEICGNVFHKNIREHFHSNGRCSECSGKFLYNKESFIERANKKYQDKFLYHRIKNEEIMNSDSKPEIECSKCGYLITNTTVRSFLHSNRSCDRCENKESWNSEKLKRRCEERAKEGQYSYENVDFSKDYKRRDIISIVCISCKKEGKEYIFEQTIDDHLVGRHGCRICAGNKPWKYRLESACKEKQKEGKYDYSLVDYSKTENMKTEIPIICLKCKEDGFKKYVFDQTITVHFWMGCGCPRCGKSLQWDYEMFLENKSRLPNSYTDKYIYDRIKPEEVTHGRSIISVGCKSCSRYFKRSITNHITMMRGCRYCSKSEAARTVFTYLENNNIEFEDEFGIEGLKGVKYRYDFKFLYNGVIVILEVDGRQHFLKNKRFHGKEGKFEEARERDIYKQYMGLKNGYRIIRIDYTVSLKDIEKYIEEGLKCKEEIYYSNPELYEWLEEGVKNFKE